MTETALPNPLILATEGAPSVRTHPPGNPKLIGLVFQAAPVGEKTPHSGEVQILLTPQRATKLLHLLSEMRDSGVLPEATTGPVRYRERRPH